MVYYYPEDRETACSKTLLTIELVDGIHHLDRRLWDTIDNPCNPFTQYDFLLALEETGCTQQSTGWLPRHIVCKQGDTPIAVIINYVKSHSYGEYVFDWQWAEAYERFGMSYYPKLVSAYPFSPIPGTQCLIFNNNLSAFLQIELKNVMPEICEKLSLSSWHYLFSDDTDPCKKVISSQFLERYAIAFQWKNRAYSNFDDFLNQLTMKRRKAIKRERKAIQNSCINIRWYLGSDVSDVLLEKFYLCYHTTYLKRGQYGYLNLEFFKHLFENLSSNIALCVASKAEEIVACSFFFYDATRLYGRYWGCLEEIDGLHFELCYYQGIEFSIDKKLVFFDPGTQGEHKVRRGFEPYLCSSFHWIKDHKFRHWLSDFCQQERELIEVKLAELKDKLPYKD